MAETIVKENKPMQSELDLTTAADPTELMSELCLAVDRFNTSWPDYVTNAMVFRIPLYADGLVPERVEPDYVTGDEAIDLCRRAFRSFSRPREQHPGSVMRLPGYIVLNRLLLKETDTINALKMQLQNSIKEQNPNARSRNAYCREHFPGRVMLQVYRQIPSARAPLESVSFTWAPGVQATRKLAKSEAIALLTRRLESQIDASHTGRHKALKMAIEKARSIKPGKQFIVQKPHAPYPIATLFSTRGRNADKTMVPLSLPVFIGPGKKGGAPTIGRLEAYDRAKRRKARSDSIASEMLFRPLYLRVRQ